MATSRPIPIVGDAWDAYSYGYGEGQTAHVHFDVAAASEEVHCGFIRCVRVILFVQENDVKQDGQPADTQVLRRLLLAKELLLNALANDHVAARFVGAMLYGGMFDLTFQVEPPFLHRFKSSLQQIIGQIEFRLDIRESDGWTFFDTKIKPSVKHEQQIDDRNIIHQLVGVGSDPSKRHRLEHLVLGPTDALKEIARVLAENGFTRVRIMQHGLEIETESTLDLFDVWAFTGNLAELCAQVGARYDGWGAAVVK